MSYKQLKRGEFRLVPAADMWPYEANPEKSSCGWECERCWQWYKRYTPIHFVETHSNEYRICATCTKQLGLTW